ncbi:MAG: M1 family aminopeptidase [Candidatus Latescibacteria bacterium]|nr:M1 family aminopeptidase [Candidatus Latescibacterota bacterium]
MSGHRCSSASIVCAAVVWSVLALAPRPAAAAPPHRDADPGCLARAKAGLATAARVGDKSSLAGEDYDVRDYRLQLSLDPDVATYQGVVTVVYVPGLEYEGELVLDCVGPVVSGVTDGEAALPFVQSGGALRITTTGKREAAVDSVVVSFGNALPLREREGLSLWYWDFPEDTDPVISSMSQPDAARTWWPCKDRSDDKARCRVEIRAPAALTAVSNGSLVDEVDHGDGTLTRVWQEDYPIATYLVSVALSDYVEFGSMCTTAEGSVPLRHWVQPDDLTDAQVDFAPLCDMIGALEALVGRYPFAGEKYGHAEFLNMSSGAMEHQTVTSYGRNLIRGNNHYDWIMVHELAHQWFGDALTPRGWQDIWLNEGFATYFEALWMEHLHGLAPDGDDGYFYWMRSKRWASDWIGETPVYDPFPILDQVVYDKGAWILHMLRGRMGDESFFELLADWTSSVRLHGVVDTQEFVDLASEHAQADLTGFFTPWLEATTVPHLTFETLVLDGPAGDGTRLQVRLRDRSGVSFDNVYPVRVTTEAGEEWRAMRLVGAGSTQAFDFTTAVLSAELDPLGWVAWRLAAATPDPLRLLRAYPNPSFNGVVALVYVQQDEAALDLEIFDAAGRRLYRRAVAAAGSALDEREELWHGRDDAGRAVPSGVYWARLSGDAQSTVLKFAIVR